jgi:3-hydroxyisobutyrate dehydrogenase-like beta-hydroxyacid dehydrogenase
VTAALEPIGVAGLGEMGLPIAVRLLRAGHAVHGHDVSQSARDRADSMGVRVIDDLSGAASRASTWLVIVPGGAVVDVVSQLARSLSAGSLVVVCSSVDAPVMADVDATLRPAGVSVCDAALARGVPAAREGSLLLYCGGDAATIDRATPVLTTFARDVVHVGPLGSGQLTKLLNNLLLWSSVAAVTETVRLATRMGLDPDVVTSALSLGSGRGWVLETWSRPRPMPDLESDLKRGLEVATQLGLDLPLVRAVQQMMTEVKLRKAASFDGAGAARSMAEFVRATFPSAQPTESM